MTSPLFPPLDTVGTADRPLFVVDVDEVVLRFVAPLERFIGTRGYELLPRSFALTGNIVRAGADQAIPGAEVKALIAAFFAEGMHLQEPVDGALAALERLAGFGEVLLLSNVPAFAAEERRRHLADLGVRAPLVPNDGAKGPPLARLAERRAALGITHPVVFVDDGPTNLASARDHAPDTRLVHFVDDPRWFALSPDVAGTWIKTRVWETVLDGVETLLAPSRVPDAGI